MILTKTTQNYLFTLLFLLVFALPAVADDDTGFEDNVDDEKLPVNSYVLPMVMAGIATAYVILRKKGKAA